MPVYEFYIYSSSALGYNGATGSFDFDAGYNHWEDRYRIVVNDDDSTMNATGDGNQFATVYDMDGNVVDSGLITVPAYVEISIPGGGITYLDRIEVNGTHYGYTPDDLLTPGQSYPVNYSGTDNLNHTYYDANSVPCFAPGTWIETAAGPRRIETLRAGDMIRTRDRGDQPLIWIGRWQAGDGQHPPDPKTWPVTLTANPETGAPLTEPLVLSAQHRVLLDHPALQLQFGANEVLAPAGGLGTPMRPDRGEPLIWMHLLLDRHEVIRANGVWVESLFIGEALPPALPPYLMAYARASLRHAHAQTARPCLRRWEAALASDVLGLQSPRPLAA